MCQKKRKKRSQWLFLCQTCELRVLQRTCKCIRYSMQSFLFGCYHPIRGARLVLSWRPARKGVYMWRARELLQYRCTVVTLQLCMISESMGWVSYRHETMMWNLLILCWVGFASTPPRRILKKRFTKKGLIFHQGFSAWLCSFEVRSLPCMSYIAASHTGNSRKPDLFFFWSSFKSMKIYLKEHRDQLHVSGSGCI